MWINSNVFENQLQISEFQTSEEKKKGSNFLKFYDDHIAE